MIEAEGAAALLDGGVSVPLKEVRIPFRKKPLRLRAMMRRPRLGGLIRLSRVYLRLGVTAAEMEKFTKEEEMAFIAAHGKDLSLMVAYTLCRGWLWRKLLVRPTAWWIEAARAAHGMVDKEHDGATVPHGVHAEVRAAAWY